MSNYSTMNAVNRDTTTNPKLNQTSYPSEWFKNNPNRKPVVRIKRTNVTNENLGRMIKSSFANLKLDREMVVEFMYIHMQKISSMCTEDWKSFGREIGKAGETITPLDLLTVERYDGSYDAVLKGAMLTDEEMSGYFWYLVAIYRIASVLNNSNYGYICKVIKDVEAIFKNRPYLAPPLSMDGISKQCYGWSDNTEYAALIAALDMFLVRFPNHQFASARVSTVVSRDKGCVVLNGLHGVSKISRVSPSDLLPYITIEKVADQAFTLLEEEQELDLKDSYFHYLIDMRLTHKSPYSASACPELHLWIHTVGVACGSMRSRNAQRVGDFATSSIINSGLLTGYALIKRHIHEIQAVSDVSKLAELERQARANVNQLEDSTPESVAFQLESNNGELPADIKEQFQKNFLHESRKGTIGEAIKFHLGY